LPERKVGMVEQEEPDSDDDDTVYLGVPELRKRLKDALPNVSTLSIPEALDALATFEQPLPPEVHGLKVRALRDRLRKHLPDIVKLDRDGLIRECLLRGLITQSDADAKRRRPDISAKRKNARVEKEFCRTMSLSRLLKGVRNKDVVVGHIVDAVDSVSQIMHQRSFLVLLHLRRLMLEGRQLPDLLDKNATFFRHCFTVGIGTTQNLDIEETLRLYRNEFWALSAPPKGMGNTVSYAAKLYKTAFVNHFTLLDNMAARIKRILSYSLHGIEAPDEGSSGQGGVKDAYDAVMEDKHLAGDLEQYQPVVDGIRTALGLPAGAVLTEAWLKANIGSAIRFVLTVCQRIDSLKVEAQRVIDAGGKVRKGATRGIKFCPTHRCAPHNVKIDASDMAQLFKSAGTVESGCLDVETPIETVRSVLKGNVSTAFPLLAPFFTGTIDTDGTSVSLHFRRSCTKRQLKAKEEGKARAKAAAEAKASGTKLERAQRETKVQTRPAPRVLLSVDVGRVNLVFVHVIVDGQPLMEQRANGTLRRVTFKMTAAQYYTASGIRRRRRIMLGRRKTMKLDRLDHELSKTTLRSSDVSDVLAYLRTFKAQRSVSWRWALHKKTRQDKLRARAGKARTIHRFFSHIKTVIQLKVPDLQSSQVTVAWGNAKVSPTGRGNVAVPTGGVGKAACLRFKGAVHQSDEYRSSRCCPRKECQHQEMHAARAVAKRECCLRIRYPRRSMSSNIRQGFVTSGTNSKRMAKRAGAKERCRDCYEHQLRALQTTLVTRWHIVGYEGDKRRRDDEAETRHLRGLRFCQGCQKYMDRDCVGAENIGTIWLQDNVLGARHDSFDRVVQARLRPPRIKKKRKPRTTAS